MTDDDDDDDVDDNDNTDNNNDDNDEQQRIVQLGNPRWKALKCKERQQRNKERQ